MFFKKFNNIKIRPDNQFGRILNNISTFFAIFGGLVLLIAALISIFSIFGRVVFSSPILISRDSMCCCYWVFLTALSLEKWECNSRLYNG